MEFHRSSRCKVKNHQLGESKIGQAGSFSFIPVEGHKSCNALMLIDCSRKWHNWKWCLCTVIHQREKFFKFKFKYNQEKKKHELYSYEGKKCAIEKSAALRSPVITDKGVIGVVGEDADGQLIPYFITQTELGKLKCLVTLLKDICFIFSAIPISTLQGLWQGFNVLSNMCQGWQSWIFSQLWYPIPNMQYDIPNFYTYKWYSCNRS